MQEREGRQRPVWELLLKDQQGKRSYGPWEAKWIKARRSTTNMDRGILEQSEGLSEGLSEGVAQWWCTVTSLYKNMDSTPP